MHRLPLCPSPRDVSTARRRLATLGLICLTSLAAASTVGCAGAGMEPYTAYSRKTPLRPDQLFAAVDRAFDKLEYRPVGRDAEAYTVATREKEVGYSSVPRLSYRYSFQIDTKGGTLKIEATCTQNSAMKREVFTPCGKERPQRVIDEQEALAKEIIEIAQSLP